MSERAYVESLSDGRNLGPLDPALAVPKDRHRGFRLNQNRTSEGKDLVDVLGLKNDSRERTARENLEQFVAGAGHPRGRQLRSADTLSSRIAHFGPLCHLGGLYHERQEADMSLGLKMVHQGGFIRTW